MSECLSGKDQRCQVRIKLKDFHAKVQHFYVSPIFSDQFFTFTILTTTSLMTLLPLDDRDFLHPQPSAQDC